MGLPILLKCLIYRNTWLECVCGIIKPSLLFESVSKPPSLTSEPFSHPLSYWLSLETIHPPLLIDQANHGGCHNLKWLTSISLLFACHLEQLSDQDSAKIIRQSFNCSLPKSNQKVIGFGAKSGGSNFLRTKGCFVPIQFVSLRFFLLWNDTGKEANFSRQTCFHKLSEVETDFWSICWCEV